MDGLGYTVTVVLPLLAVAIKFGIMFSVWGLVIAVTRLVQAATAYIHSRTK